MKFIGQEGILRELIYILPEFEAGRNMNILFSAPSGYGKTTLAFLIIGKLGVEQDTAYYIPDNDGNINFDHSKRFHLIDEAQNLKNPEILYRYMDDNSKYSVFILTNELGNLKEPVINRCIPFYFSPYTEEDIFSIVESVLISYDLDVNIISVIVQNCKNNPRVTKKVCERLENVFRVRGIPKTKEDILYILQNILRIYNGLNDMDFMYLNFLQKVGRAGLVAIANGIHMDKNTIQKEIEPFLIEKGIIQITPRGRILAKDITEWK